MPKKDEKKTLEGELIAIKSGFITTPIDGVYTLPDRLLAIEFLDANQQIKGEVTIPRYSDTSKELGIPESTLRRWWKQKDQIVCQAETSLASLPTATAIQMSIEAKTIVNVLKARGYETISTRDLLTMHKQFIITGRLLTGRSTSNILVGSGAPPPPVK